MEHRPIGLLVAAAGALLVVIGVLVYLGAFNWLGKLPGDLRIERENARIYVPLASMLVISLLLTLLLNLLRRLF